VFTNSLLVLEQLHLCLCTFLQLWNILLLLVAVVAVQVIFTTLLVVALVVIALTKLVNYQERNQLLKLLRHLLVLLESQLVAVGRKALTVLTLYLGLSLLLAVEKVAPIPAEPQALAVLVVVTQA
jgi:hypothetical protein